jgi:hypothetical protein
MEYQAVSLAERPELLGPALEPRAVGWPEFMQHDPAAERYEARLPRRLPQLDATLAPWINRNRLFRSGGVI